MSGILYICGTPIGNLEDMSLRAIRILQEVDIIACEDTRHTIKLLNHFNIKNQLEAYHEHNKHDKAQKILEQLQYGKNIALVTDAGMPCISDPGYELISLCHENNIKTTVIPGATALTTALALSGMPSERFVFEGFLPQNNKNRREIIQSLVNEPRTIIFYEAPHHLVKTLTDLFTILGNRQISIVRELTKIYEEVKRDSIENMLVYYSQNSPKGEFVLIVEGAKQKINDWEDISVEEHVAEYINSGMDKMTAIKTVAKDRGVSKSKIYSILNKN